MIYGTLEVSRYIIKYSNERRYMISNLKLQKILYFIQAYFLRLVGQPCFAGRIEAWDFGPVVPKAYNEYKQYGSGNIPWTEPYRLDRINGFDGIETDDKRKIEQVVDLFSPYSATDLVKLTQRQLPWKVAYGHSKGNEITLKAISEYFRFGLK